MSNTIAIIGGGFSGTLAAVQLLRRRDRGDLHIVLVNRSGLLARGVAYGTRTETHVLNVPVGRMGAFADDEQSFLRFAQLRDPTLEGGAFVPRQLYGEYLGWLLQDALSAKLPTVVFSHRIDHVIDCAPRADGRVDVLFEQGASLCADRVILALGNFAPCDPPLADPHFFDQSNRYIRDPWQPGALERVDLSKPVLLIGSGLTAVDIALDLSNRGLRRPLYALSRRGLAPKSHRGLADVAVAVALPSGLWALPPTARNYVRTLRRHIQMLSEQGVDWRDTIGALRGVTPQLWQQLSAAERARFTRHVQAHWEIYRHRLAPHLAEQFAALQTSGQLRLRAGRLQSVIENAGWVDATFRPRGLQASESLAIGTVINCTGPNNNTRRLQEPLLNALNRRGLVRSDALGLGLDIAADYSVRSADGRSSASIYYVGPFLKAQFWEATAVPELRAHVALAVQALLDNLPKA
jgi:uncharacterized NAD(P)/FAD-binding protein YdhS